MYSNTLYPSDYGLPKIAPRSDYTRNAFQPYVPTINRQNYRNSRHFFKPIILPASPFKKSNEKIRNNKRSISKEGVFLDQSPVQFRDGRFPHMGPEDSERHKKLSEVNEKRMEQDLYEQGFEPTTIRKSAELKNDQNKLFDILRIIKDCRNETKYKRYSMNNFDDFKKAKESDFNGKGCEEKLSLNESLVNLITFQNLNNNLDKGSYFLKIICCHF